MTIDRSKLWTGDLNAHALEPQPRLTVGLYDTTLRDGEQTVGVVLSPEDKLAIATALAEAGVDRIEAGFPRVSEEDTRAIRLILEAGLDAEIWGFSRAVQADVEALVELGITASVIESPVSDGKLAALGVSREAMLGRIRSAVSFAVENGIRVAYFGVDSTRADLAFLRAAYEAAVDAGAVEVVVVDTLGIATPEAAAFLVGDMCALPLPDQSFDVVTTGYGLRNVPDLPAAVGEIARVLRPGGLLLSLDFNRPAQPVVRAAYHGYLTLVGSLLGWALHRDPDTYRYIPESIRRYPGAPAVTDLLRANGFAHATWHRVLGGLMAVHEARRD